MSNGSSGQQKAQEYAQRVGAWIAHREAANDFLEYERNGKINRQALCAELDFGRSVVSQNPAVRAELEDAEQRWYGAKQNDVKAHQAAVERSERRVAKSNNDVNKLLDQIAKLSAENALLRRQLSKYEVMSEILAETGFVPR